MIFLILLSGVARCGAALGVVIEHINPFPNQLCSNNSKALPAIHNWSFV